MSDTTNWRASRPRTPEGLSALPVFTDRNVFPRRDVESDDAVFAFSDADGVWAPVYAHGQWWKQAQWIF